MKDLPFYQYIGTNHSLEESCIQDMLDDSESMSINECCKLLDVDVDMLRVMFPRLGEGWICRAAFDGVDCIYYELGLSNGKRILFVWIRL